MKLLFAKNEEVFPEEIKNALGFIDADFPFIKIKADLRSATSEIKKVIGQEVYDDLIEIYEEEAPEEEATQFLEIAQYAIATAAYRLFAPSNDLQHGVNGRKMLTSEDSKTPFEHMLVASNDELSRRSFRAMDDLLKYLDINSETWKASDEYKLSHSLFVRTIEDFDNVFPIHSRYLMLKLKSGLEAAEQREIIPTIGRDVFDTLKKKLNGEDDTELTELESNLIALIKKACVFSALSWGVTRLQGTMFPEGVLQQVRGDRQTIKGRVGFTGNQPDQLEQKFKEDTVRVLKDIETLVAPEEDNEDTDNDKIDFSSMFGFDEDSPGVLT